MAEEGKENSYEQKIKQEDEARARRLQQMKAMKRNAIIIGLAVAMPTLLFVGYIIQKNAELDILEEKMLEEDMRYLKDRAKKPQYPMQRLYF